MRLFLLTALSLCLQANAQGKGADTTTGIRFFTGTWQQALEKASKENKVVFVDCYAVWCAPCAYLSKNVFTRKEIGDYFNARFINVKMDMETEPGKTLKDKYAVHAYPTLLLINPRGYKLDAVVGGGIADSLRQWAGHAAKAIDTPPLQEYFDNGRRDEKFLLTYFSWLITDQQVKKARTDLEKIFRQQGDTAMYQRRYFRLLPLADLDSHAADFFLSHLDKFVTLYGKQQVDETVTGLYTSYDRLAALLTPKPGRKVQDSAWSAYLSTIDLYHLSNAAFLKNAAAFYIKCSLRDYNAAMQLARSMTDSCEATEYFTLAKIAHWVLYDTVKRAVAAGWALQAAAGSESLKTAATNLAVALKKNAYFNPPYIFPSTEGITLASLQDTGSGIRFFEGDWQEALHKAHEEHKLVFLDCYTSWCGPCKTLARTIFTLPGIGEYFNAHFINVGIDMEKGIGPSLEKKYRVHYYPTLLFINPEGYYVVRNRGLVDSAGLRMLAEQGLAAKDSISFDQRFNAGDRSETFMRTFLYSFLQDLNDRNQPQVDTLIRRVIGEKGFEILYKQPYFDALSFISIESPAAIYLGDHWEQFAAIYGKDQVTSKLADMYNAYYLLYTRMFETTLPHHFKMEGYQAYIKCIRDRKLPDAAFITARVNLFAFRTGKAHDSAMQEAVNILKNGQDWELYQMAKTVAIHGLPGDKKIAAGWAEKASRLTTDPRLKKQAEQLFFDLSSNKPFSTETNDPSSGTMIY